MIVFSCSVLVRQILLLLTYNNLSIFDHPGHLDLARHALYYSDFINGRLFYLDIFHKVYSPVTSFVLFLVTFPFYFTHLHVLYITMIGMSIIMGINAIGVYVLLNDLFGKRTYLTVLLAIFNPMELVGLLPWGGVSMAITCMCTIWAIIIQRKIMKKEFNPILGVILITVLILTSATAHRTGEMIQLAAVLLLLALYGKRLLSRYKILILPVIASLAVLTDLFFARAYSLVRYHFKLDPYYLNYFTDIKIQYALEFLRMTLPIFIIMAIGSGLLIYDYYKRTKDPVFAEKTRKMGVFKLYPLEKIYLISNSILFLIPITDPTLSGRFLIGIDFAALILLIYPYIHLELIYDKTKKLLYIKIFYWLIMIIFSISSFFLSIATTNQFINKKFNLFMLYWF